MMFTGPKKKQRLGSNTHLSTLDSSSSTPDGTVIETTLHSFSFHHPNSSTASLIFNDQSTADVILTLHLESLPSFPDPDPKPESEPEHEPLSPPSDHAHFHLHSNVLRRSQYFSALLSDRWQGGSETVIGTGTDENLEKSARVFHLNLTVPSLNSIDTHATVLQLLYTNDYSNALNSVSSALTILPVAVELLCQDCIDACIRFLESVPWTEEEEIRVLNTLPLLTEEEAYELLVRITPATSSASEEMLQGLIRSAVHNNHNMAFPKAFVAKLLRDFGSRETARRVLDKAFEESLKLVKQALEDYSSPDFRGDHNEIEAIQRLNLHKALTNGRHLLWLVERMIELRVADNAVKEWSDQASFTADLQRAFCDDAWRNIVPGLPVVVLRSTCRLANAVVTGSLVACREVRIKLVKVWLPVLIVSRDKMLPTLPNHKTLYQELEETFLNIISTLPMSDAQELLQQCLSFSTRNIDDCPHLTSAFNTWFRRARRPPQVGSLN